MNSRFQNARLQPMVDRDAGTGTHVFEGFLREQRELLLGFLRLRTASEEDAQDAAQESLVRLMRYRQAQPQENWKPLLYRIATNVAHDQSRWAQSRHAAGHVPIDESVHALPSQERPQLEQLVAQQELARIGDIIATLPPRCQEVYLLSRVEGMTNTEIARHCDISLKAVEKHITRALTVMRRTLGDRDRNAF